MSAKVIQLHPTKDEPQQITLSAPDPKRPGVRMLVKNGTGVVWSMPLTRGDRAVVKQLLEMAELFDSEEGGR
jgi:hypothetical protein